jgi:pyrroloquinoline-quinone synthase
MHSLIDQIDLEIERYSLLKHDFYRLWQEGKLTLDHLAGYSKEYFQLVKAVPLLVENALKTNKVRKYENSIQTILQDESEHIEPWIKFSSSLKVDKTELMDYVGEDLTKQSVGHMIKLSESSFEEAVAVLYAFEKQLPKISETKLDGLAKFYGITDEESNEYFNIHKEIDIYHSKIWENIIKESSDDKKEKILNAVVLSLEEQNRLLDSVKSKYVDNTIAC